MGERIWLSPPEIAPGDAAALQTALAGGWVAPAGPQLEAFERCLEDYCGGMAALATVSGTAAIHLGLRLMGVGPGDLVLCPTLTFVASANPIRYLGAEPVFIDAAAGGYHIDPLLLAEAIETLLQAGKQPKAVILVHLYGLPAPMDELMRVCQRYGLPVLEDAAEALGARYHGEPAGTFGSMGVFSFNGNKIITTSGGGALLGRDAGQIEHGRQLAAHARLPAPHYEHAELGYNYRLSNLLAALGHSQFAQLEERVDKRRRINAYYRSRLGDLPGVSFPRELPGSRASFWLTTFHIDPAKSPVPAAAVLRALEAENLDARPVWKPLHTQPLFEGCEFFTRAAEPSHAEDYARTGICLPSGTGLADADLERIANVIRRCFGQA